MQKGTLADPYTVPACHGSLSHSLSLAEKVPYLKKWHFVKILALLLTLFCFLVLFVLFVVFLPDFLLPTKLCVRQVQFLD